MKLKINNEFKEVEDNISVTTLLKVCEVEMPDMVSVQLNGEFIKRADFTGTILKENDELEFLYFMGGGG